MCFRGSCLSTDIYTYQIYGVLVVFVNINDPISARLISDATTMISPSLRSHGSSIIICCHSCVGIICIATRKALWPKVRNLSAWSNIPESKGTVQACPTWSHPWLHTYVFQFALTVRCVHTYLHFSLSIPITISVALVILVIRDCNVYFIFRDL